jgi:hypothetical protein
LFINNGDGTFTDESATRLPAITAETRDVEFGDIDNDGDLDLYVSNVSFFRSLSTENQLLINDGTGVFTQTELPATEGNNVDSDIMDLDGDGFMDIISSTAFLTDEIGAGTILLNNTDGTFSRRLFTSSGNTFDIVQLDSNGDGNVDLYFCNRLGGSTTGQGPQGGQDQLFIRN